MKKNNRPIWDQYFFNIVDDISLRSTCLRRKVGAVIVKNNRILSTGYNGAPVNHPHCSKCLREEMKIKSGQHHEICNGVHAEQNAIIQAAKFGISIDNSVLYISCSPCSICTKMIINAGISIIKFKEYYEDKLSKQLFINSGYKVTDYFVYRNNIKDLNYYKKLYKVGAITLNELKDKIK